MSVKIDPKIRASDLEKPIQRLFEASEAKIHSLKNRWQDEWGSPVYTVKGRYVSREWTDWTKGFYLGSAFLQFDATGEVECLDWARSETLKCMTNHLTDSGVHDHGFNIISTYGNWWRLLSEGKASDRGREQELTQTALRVSGAVQAMRWTRLPEGGYVYSFNGPHSLFIDTLRSMRSLAVAHELGQVLLGEQNERICLLQRCLDHSDTTIAHSIFFGKNRDIYDVRGRVAHESLFNVKSGQFRCHATQQGYSPFSTWTRGLAWALCGLGELLEYLQVATPSKAVTSDRLQASKDRMLGAALACADFYLENTPSCGVPYWDTGAPGLSLLKDWADKPADPFNAHEPVDSSAAAIAAQGFLRLGQFLACNGFRVKGRRYEKAGLTIAKTLFSDPYLSTDPRHDGLLLHSVYHRPRGWDHIARDQKVPNAESSMWGDYHLRELADLIGRQIHGEKYLQFFGGNTE